MALTKVLFLAAAMTAKVFGAVVYSVPGHEDCNGEVPSVELLAAAREMQIQETSDSHAAKFSLANITLDAYMHVITGYNSTAQIDGYLTEAQVKKTLADINSGFADIGFQFALKGIDYAVDPYWASGEDQLRMKSSLRKGDYRTLNLYFIPGIPYNGRCYYPGRGRELQEVLDGCEVRTDVYDNGQTATHEVGHWFGLFHTFNGELDDPDDPDNSPCDIENDLVDDTPAMRKGWSCDPTDDTCPFLPGNDPVNNYMSYGDCRNQFTPGQKTRMISMYKTFRA